MADKNSQLVGRQEDVNIGLTPLLVAGAICFAIALLLGIGSWYVFNANREKLLSLFSNNSVDNSPSANTVESTPVAENTPVAIVESSPAVTDPANIQPSPGSSPIAEQPQNVPSAETTKIENVVSVAGGEIALGGGDTKKPIERRMVGNFSIAETEVTNAQYAEFLKETKHSPPTGWNNSEFPKGTENYPVTNVSWNDAVAYCNWLAKKLGRTVRLPTDAEWELAARGKDGNKYPWGNDWKNEAAFSKENGNRVSSVKSFPLNRSPFGAYDMAGNVWEWTQTKVGRNYYTEDKLVKAAIAKGENMRIVKGGSAKAKKSEITAQATFEVPENAKIDLVGFRYIVEEK